MSNQVVIPIINVAPLLDENASLADKQKVADELGKACVEVGFITIVGHGVPDEVINSIWTSTRSFFDQDLATKSEYVKPQDVYPFGYNPIGTESLISGKLAENNKDSDVTGNPPDIKEMFSLGPRDPAAGFPPRIFPTTPTEFEPAWTTYYETLSNLGKMILEGFALALGLEKDYFHSFVTHHASALRAINYPAIPLGQTVLPGQLRASDHTDYGAITILRTDGAGLQVSKDLNPPVWHDVPYIEGAFIINLGDLMRRWTNEKWCSTLHRVVISSADFACKDASSSSKEQAVQCRRRQSIAFFYNVNRDATVQCITNKEDNEVAKYEPIIAGDFLLQKHLASMGMKM